ncbi:MAG: hypothetical protein ABL893_05920 [Hyphomicrobium sp.]
MKASDIFIAKKLIEKRDGLMHDLDQLIDPANSIYVQLLNNETGDELGSFGGEDDPDIGMAIRIGLAEKVRGEIVKTEAALAELGVTDLDEAPAGSQAEGDAADDAEAVS